MLFNGVLCVLALAVTASADVDSNSAADVQRRDDGLAGAHQPAARAARHRRHRKRNGRCHHAQHPLSSAESTSGATATWSQAESVEAYEIAPTTSATTWSDTAVADTWSASTDAATVPAAATESPVAVAASNSNALAAAGVTQFSGTNSGIGSWFKTSSGQDSTNGKSWCQTPYQDDWLGFAPDVSVMLNNFGGDTAKAATAYCGLEARATYNGVTRLIYIVDGFDPAWVRTPGSIDLTLGAFGALFGYTTDDKNVVMQDLKWELTGNRKEEYSYMHGRNW